MLTKKWAIYPACLLIFVLGYRFLPEYQLYQISLISATAIVVLGLVVVCGIAGQISLGQAAFVALGGYGAAILTTRLGLPLYAAIPLTAVACALLGYLLGLVTLRVSGHYLALATMAITAIVQLAIINLDGWTGGAAGMPMPAFELGGHTLDNGASFYLLIVPVLMVCHVLVRNLMRSRVGQAYAALRQSETAAAAMGVDVLRYKASAFAASGFLGALGGGLLGALSSYLDPAQFGITQTVHFLAMAVIGGMATPLGAIIGSAIFVLIPELLQGLQSYLGLVFAILLLAFIVLRPAGLAGLLQMPRTVHVKLSEAPK